MAKWAPRALKLCRFVATRITLLRNGPKVSGAVQIFFCTRDSDGSHEPASGPLGRVPMWDIVGQQYINSNSSARLKALPFCATRDSAGRHGPASAPARPLAAQPNYITSRNCDRLGDVVHLSPESPKAGGSRRYPCCTFFCIGV